MDAQRRLILWISVAVMALLLFANDGFRSLVSQGLERRRLQNRLTKLRADHEALTKEWTLIQKDPSYTEYLIRRDLGYVKKGEVEYRIVEKK